MRRTDINTHTKKSSRNTRHQFYLATEAVNSGIDKLIIGSFHHRVTEKKGLKALHSQAKTINVDFKQAQLDNPYDARCDGILQLMKKVRTGDRVEIFTFDPQILELSRPQSSRAQNASRRFNDFASDKNVEIISPKDMFSFYSERMDTAERLLRIHINALKNQGDDMRGYRQDRRVPRGSQPHR